MAGQEICILKIRQTIFGCMRTMENANEFAAIRSYIATAAEHDITMVDAVSHLTRQHSWYPVIT